MQDYLEMIAEFGNDCSNANKGRTYRGHSQEGRQAAEVGDTYAGQEGFGKAHALQNQKGIRAMVMNSNMERKKIFQKRGSATFI